MTNFKRFFTLALVMLGVAVTLSAQKKEKDYELFPHWFVGLQGGVQNTFSKDVNNWKTFTPTASASFGRWFLPAVGARLHVNGAWNKAGVVYLDGTENSYYNYNYITPNADVLVNLCNLFGKKDDYPVNLLFIAGIGANYAWETLDRAENAAATGVTSNMLYADNDSRWAFNGRLGLGLDIPVHKNVSVNVEALLNHIVPGNNKTFNTDPLQFVGQVGVNYNFGYKKKPQPEEVWETRIDTIWYNDIAYTPRVEDGTITWNVFYQIRESDFNDPNAQLAAIGAFLKDHRECKVTIKSYADVQTGNPKINMEYSKQRSEKAVKALVDAGVDASIITAEYFGDTVQPFAENDKNRVSIITATGLKDVKDQYKVKKFRTQEVRELMKN
ncbi:MAG: OmpA family protein [Bacteroidaceae bacterium]|nr:OmpA family protein [Bacteroidaceae bacterium]